MAGLYFWFPKIFGRMPNAPVAYLGSALVILGFNLAFGPMHYLGLAGQPRRTHTYHAGNGWETWNYVATIGAYILGIGVVLVFGNLVWTAFRGKKCGLVITGGNIDTRLLASVLTRELVRESRIVSLRVIGDDRPGLLANVSAIIGQMGANIIEVAHNRLALDVPAKGAEFDLMIETRDRQHTQEVMDALRERGYPPRVV